MKAFIFAMEKECKPLQEKTILLKERKHGAATYEWRTYKGKEFLLVISGIGKTLSAMAVSALPFLEKETDCLLNFGVSGSLCDELRPFSFFVPDRFAHHDIDTTAFGDPMGLFFDPNQVYFEANAVLRKNVLEKLSDCVMVREGVEVAGDSFIGDPPKKAFLVSEFEAKGCDMETASIASACALLKIPFAALRIVSDSSSGAEEYQKNLQKAVLLLCEKALELI